MKKLSLALVTLMLAFGITGAAAEVRKSEIVYAKLAMDGAAQALYVVNVFESTDETELTDYGDYSEVVSLGRQGELTREGNLVKLSLPQGRYAYQGNLTSRKLPWEFAVSYELEGETLSAQQLSGKNGKLVVNLRVAVHEPLADFANACTLQVTFSLPVSKAMGILAPAATIAYAGNNITLTYVVLPGQEADYRFEAEVENFSMPGFQVGGVRTGLDRDQYLNLVDALLEDSPMKAAARPMMENFLTMMQGSTPGSFAQRENGSIQSLQFVLLSDGIPEE